MKDKEQILVSIITVSFNAANTIEQTIKSVINQTYNNIEYIIIDGASTDNTLDIANKYKKNIKHLVSEPDHGIYNAMNKGIALASGSLVGIINADDWYEPKTVETIVAHYKSKGIERDDTVYYGFLRLWKNEKEFGIRRVLHDFIPEFVIQHPTWFVPKKLYEKYGVFDESFKISSDYDLMNRFFHKSVNFCPIDAVLANFRYGGASSQSFEQSALDNRRIKLRYGYITQEEFDRFMNERNKQNRHSIYQRIKNKLKKLLS